ncbi:hypothetical protein C8R46DRAFT_1184651 [Mycena filopes]|nr:hypothetical protein C8R46DRAFT_1184651 [Mycena filopes]
MAPKKSKAELIRDELRAYIAGPTYQPGPLPGVAEEDWPACFPKDLEAAQTDAEETGEDGQETLAAQQRQLYFERGSAVLPLCLFLLLVNDLADKPPGYSKAVLASVKTPDILKRVVAKIEQSLVADIATRVDVGLYQLAGLQWELSGYSTETLTRLFSPVFSPLIQVAGQKYIDLFVPFQLVRRQLLTNTHVFSDPKKVDKKAKKPAKTAPNPPPVKRVTPAVQFIVNVRSNLNGQVHRHSTAQLRTNVQDEGLVRALDPSPVSPAAFSVASAVARTEAVSVDQELRKLFLLGPQEVSILSFDAGAVPMNEAANDGWANKRLVDIQSPQGLAAPPMFLSPGTFKVRGSLTGEGDGILQELDISPARSFPRTPERIASTSALPFSFDSPIPAKIMGSSNDSGENVMAWSPERRPLSDLNRSPAGTTDSDASMDSF